MGLNALVTRNVSNLVRSLSLEGEFNASDLYEYARAGRVSESVMILNIAVRAAIDQCSHLETFRWDLNVRLQPNVSSGLAKLCHLQDVWLRFPTNRSPQPSSEIPPLPHLTSLTVTHYDPLCFPDDLSTLFFHASKLESLKLHFSPRMREQGEQSVVLTHFFRKNIAAKKKLRLKSMGVYNLLARADHAECLDAIESTMMEHFTALNTFGLDEDILGSNPSATHFIDRTWLVPMNKEHPKPKSLRLDQLHKRHALDLNQSAGLERLYLVNARYQPETANGNGSAGSQSQTPNSADQSPRNPSSNTIQTSSSRSSRATPVPSTHLRDMYLDAICNVIGPTLQHLILPSRWVLPTAPIARLIRSCPNLTQLSAAIECSDFSVLKMLVPFLNQLWAIRILVPRAEGEEGQKIRAGFEAFVERDDAVHEEVMRENLAERVFRGDSVDFPKLRYVGLGRKVWEIGGVFEEVVKTRLDSEDGEGVENGEEWKEEVVFRRRVKRLDEKDVQHVEIWKMDSLDVI